MDGEEAVFKFNLIYFNTASSKMILDIFMAIEGMVEDGKNVSVEWIYDEDDEDMEEVGNEFKLLFDQIAFEMVTIDRPRIFEIMG